MTTEMIKGKHSRRKQYEEMLDRLKKGLKVEQVTVMLNER